MADESHDDVNCASDTVQIQMSMEILLILWARNGAVTVDRGPLSYSIKIAEETRRSGGTDEWPEWEILPRSSWNYGLVLDGDDPTAS